MSEKDFSEHLIPDLSELKFIVSWSYSYLLTIRKLIIKSSSHIKIFGFISCCCTHKNIFIMGVPSVKVLQIDGHHLYFLHSVHVWVGEQNGGTAGIGSRGWLLWDKLSQGAGI